VHEKECYNNVHDCVPRLSAIRSGATSHPLAWRTTPKTSARDWLPTDDFRMGPGRTRFENTRLQGVPDSFTFEGSDNDAYRMIGNGVSVPVGKWIGSEITRYFQ
jgi:site-specific DNA-cytosine methylase